ncbi:MAG: cadherin-like beta sandwich domain-containing protein [Crenarchaeota archaeon]|nr:cadherin-like beta sandwich domain-containing protein [Thermoproteota archaeon]
MTYKEKIGKILHRVHAEAKDVFVTNYIVYKNSEGVACINSEGLIAIGSTMLEDLYKKSVLISDGGVLYVPVSISKGSPTVTLSYLKSDSNGKPVFATIRSYEEEEFVDPVLLSLSVGGKTLAPTFGSDVTSYTTTTTDASNIVSFVPSSENAEVTVKLNGTEITDFEAVTWSAGSNTLTIKLDIEGISTTYTITVTKASPPSLSALSVGGKTLTPTFASGTYEYTASTTDATNIITFTKSPASAAVTATLGGVDVTDDLATGVTWASGENVFVLSVAAYDVATNYTVTVTKS